MRIGILGGSFDPLHYGHLTLAGFAMREFKLDKVLFVPDSESAYSDKVINASLEDRVDMLAIALEGRSDYMLDTIAVENETTYTYEVVTAIKDKHKYDDLFLILGHDSGDKFKTWKNPDEIVSRCQTLVANRDFDFPDIDIRSTIVRRRIKQNKDIKHLVPSTVAFYINTRNLYGGNDVRT